MLDEKGIEIKKISDARKEKIGPDTAWDLCVQADEIVIAKGKKTLHLPPDPVNRETITAAIMGRSGNLRAPALRLGRRLIIGYNEEIYQELGK